MSQRALQLAAEGIGQVSPGPLVGCVIISEDGEVVGEGAYIYENVTHAEAIALDQAGEKARGGTAYVSLEPHSHHAKTPPCTDALIKAGIKRVVCPIEDPNPLVSGKGFEALRENGVEVITGVLKEVAEKLNEKFIHWHREKRPFVHLKMGVSLDGKIADYTGNSKWITNSASREKVHKLRHEYDAILVGANTIVVDNPSLTDRSGKTRRRKLARIILDNSLQTPPNSNLALTANEIQTLVFTNSDEKEKTKALEGEGVKVINIAEGGRNLHGALKELIELEIQSVLVEGGGQVAGSFFDAGLIDKVSFFIAPMIIGDKKAPTAIYGRGAKQLSSALKLKSVEIINHENNVEITGYPNKK